MSAPRVRIAAVLCLAIVVAGCQTTTAIPGSHSASSIVDTRNSLPHTRATQESGSGSHYQPAFDNSSWLNSIHPLYAQARLLVENELNVDLASIHLTVVDDQPINAEVARETRRLVEAQFGPSTFSDRFLSKVMSAQAGTYAALFSARLKAVLVSRNMLASYERSLPQNSDIRTAALLTLLIHELVHAADDQQYHIHDKRALNFRASFAQSATFEGHAQWVTRRICARNNCSAGLDALDSFMFNRNLPPSELAQPVEAISRNVLEYSYIEGERFITKLAERKNGAFLIDSLLRKPPYDPIQILAPESFPDNPREQRNQRLIQASRDIDHPWVNGSWIGVETSPLKGVNLRSDPSRRRAAVDGFTRLIQGMVAIQLYDRSKPATNPIEVTLLHTESAHTAKLFASTLHKNSQLAGATANNEPLRIRTGAGVTQSEMTAHVYRTAVGDKTPYRTTIAVSGAYVVQIAGATPKSTTLDDYAIRVLLNLQLGQI